MPPSDLRLESFISTDRVFYKPLDVIFIEVLLIDTMSKKPYVSASSDTPREVTVNIQIYDLYGDLFSEGSISTTTVGPTAAFSFKLPSESRSGDY